MFHVKQIWSEKEMFRVKQSSILVYSYMHVDNVLIVDYTYRCVFAALLQHIHPSLKTVYHIAH